MPLTKRDLSRVESFIRSGVFETVRSAARLGKLAGDDSAGSAYPLPHADTHDELNAEATDPIRVENLRTLCVNGAGVLIPKWSVVAVIDGAPDGVSGVTRPAVVLADATDPAKLPPYGITLEDIPALATDPTSPGAGDVLRTGRAVEVELVYASGWSSGAEVYLDSAVPGGLTDVVPPGRVFRIATVLANDEDDPLVEAEVDGGILLVDVEDVTDLVGGSPLLTTKEVSANYTVETAVDLVLGDASGGTITVTLPPAGPADGRVIRIKKIDTGGGFGRRVIIDGDGAELVEDVAQFDLRRFGEVLELVSDGVQWWVGG